MITTSSIPTKNRKFMTREEIGLAILRAATEPIEDEPVVEEDAEEESN